MLEHYISIEKGDDLEKVISKIKRITMTLNYRPIDRGVKLTGNHKVLTLARTYSQSQYIKVDGPSFLIDKVFNYFY